MRVLSMTIPQIQALTDGQFFLEHGVQLLGPLTLEPYCRRCLALGLVPCVAITTGETQTTFRCAHTSGWVKRDEPLDMEPLLVALGWDIRCSQCQQPATANNAPTDALLAVECACALRTMANPLATRVSSQASAHTVAQLGCE